MEYGVIELNLKTQKTKYVIQTSEHIFLICTDCVVHNDIVLKDISAPLLCFAELKCF